MERISEWPVVPRARKMKYDWDTILDGSIWKLEPGEVQSANNFRSAAFQQAKKRGLKITTCVDHEGNIYMQSKKEEPSE